jgi:hypothetical protein
MEIAAGLFRPAGRLPQIHEFISWKICIWMGTSDLRQRTSSCSVRRVVWEDLRPLFMCIVSHGGCQLSSRRDELVIASHNLLAILNLSDRESYNLSFRGCLEIVEPSILAILIICVIDVVAAAPALLSIDRKSANTREGTVALEKGFLWISGIEIYDRPRSHHSLDFASSFPALFQDIIRETCLS